MFNAYIKMLLNGDAFINWKHQPKEEEIFIIVESVFGKHVFQKTQINKIVSSMYITEDDFKII